MSTDEPKSAPEADPEARPAPSAEGSEASPPPQASKNGLWPRLTERLRQRLESARESDPNIYPLF
ncbi:MAG: hypothetical protein HY791_13155 [Deltaproteobacteria bacterium]|nr:hypothetical protein [Deltaproteobacteria bacterium]